MARKLPKHSFTTPNFFNLDRNLFINEEKIDLFDQIMPIAQHSFEKIKELTI